MCDVPWFLINVNGKRVVSVLPVIAIRASLFFDGPLPSYGVVVGPLVKNVERFGKECGISKTLIYALNMF